MVKKTITYIGFQMILYSSVDTIFPLSSRRQCVVIKDCFSICIGQNLAWKFQGDSFLYPHLIPAAAQQN